MTRIGELRERVVVQQKSTTTDSQLGRARAYTTLATVWAAVRQGSAGEAQENNRVTTSNSYEVEVQYRADITPVMQLSWTPYGGSAKTLRIVGIRLKPGRPEFMLLDCQEAA